MQNGGTTPGDRLSWAYRTAVSRYPETQVKVELRRVYDKHLAYYRKELSEAKRLIKAGYAPLDNGLDVADLAAWTSVARILLNLNETITRY